MTVLLMTKQHLIDIHLLQELRLSHLSHRTFSKIILMYKMIKSFKRHYICETYYHLLNQFTTRQKIQETLDFQRQQNIIFSHHSHMYVKVKSGKIAMLLTIFLNKATSDCFVNLGPMLTIFRIPVNNDIVYVTYFWFPWRRFWQESMCNHSYPFFNIIK